MRGNRMSCGRIHFDESRIRADGMPPHAAWSAFCDEHGYRGPARDRRFEAVDDLFAHHNVYLPVNA